MKKRKISDSDTNEIQSGKIESKKCFLKSVPKNVFYVSFYFLYQLKFHMYRFIFPIEILC